MKCLYPRTIKHISDAGIPQGYTVPCGKCYACLSNRRSQWSFRLEQELKVSTSAYFVTLTYDDSHLYFNGNGLASVCKRDIQLFMKRLRKQISGSTLRYFLVSEYGPKTFRPHYHGIFFNIPGTRDEVTDLVLKCWSSGHVVVGTVTSASISYCAKYCLTHFDDFRGRDPTFALMSRKPGIGANYVKSMNGWHNDDIDRFYAVRPGGQKVSLPRYYQERVYDDSVRAYHAEKVRTENVIPEYSFSVPDEEQDVSVSFTKQKLLDKKLLDTLTKNAKI